MSYIADVSASGDQGVTDCTSGATGAIVQGIQGAAKICEALPYVQGLAAILNGIAKIYITHQECKLLRKDLPAALQHFGVKMSRVKSMIDRPCPWLVSIFKDLETELQDTQCTLKNYCRRRKMLSFLADFSFQDKLKEHTSKIEQLNSRLRDVTDVYMLHNITTVMNTVGGFSMAASFRGDAQAAQVNVDVNSQVVQDAIYDADLLMEELDTNGDGEVTIDEMFNNPTMNQLVGSKDTLVRLITRLFDQNGDGKLQFREVLGLATAIQQISKLFHTMARNSPSQEYIPSTTIVQTLHSIGYTQASMADVELVADRKPNWFRWEVVVGSTQVTCSYEGFLCLYLHLVDAHDLWSHARERLRATPADPSSGSAR